MQTLPETIDAASGAAYAVPVAIMWIAAIALIIMEARRK